MRIFVAGMSRVGSMWTDNVTRTLLLATRSFTSDTIPILHQIVEESYPACWN